MKILLLEDELMLQSAISEYLDELGHKVIAFASGKDAQQILQKESFDILILDINVPHIDGFELLETLHEQAIYTPVIFISAMVDIEDISKAFSLGAYDYIKKPFHLKELWLRVDRVAQQMSRSQRQHILLSENYSYDKEQRMLFYYDQEQTLTRKQQLILELLCKNIDMIVPFDKFRSFVWNHEPVDNATIRAEISRLRRTLKEEFILNIKGVGYKISRHIPS